MSVLSKGVLAEARAVARELSSPALTKVIEALDTAPAGLDANSLHSRVCAGLGSAQFRYATRRLIDSWITDAPDASGSAIAAAVAAADFCGTEDRRASSLELIWTGPSPRDRLLRRTDQALLQLINEAQREVTIVSFAVFRVPEVSRALERALNRGVAVRFIAETPEDDDAPFGVSATFSETITRRSRIYAWPREHRPVNEKGRPALLHIKCAIADRRTVFLSSANLTEHAMTRNMEMGLLVVNESLANQISGHLDGLISDGVLVPLS